jgi:nucleoside-diphosphate-sugar epimerase
VRQFDWTPRAARDIAATMRRNASFPARFDAAGAPPENCATDRRRSQSMRVVVTGGAGFLGRTVAGRLADAHHDVVVVDRAPRPAHSPATVAHVQADLRDRPALAAALEGADALVHAAFAPPYVAPDELRSVNVDAVDSLLRVARSAGVAAAVIVSSTIVERPARAHPIGARSSLARFEAYRRTRIEAEAVAQAYGAELRVAIARPKTFVGPGQVGAFALVFSLVRAGAIVPLLGSGTNRYQLVDVRDLADGIARLAGTGAGVYHFGALRFGTVRDDLGAVIAAAGTGARLRPLPGSIGRLVARGLEVAGSTPLAEWHHCTAAGTDSVVDIERARADLGWHPARSNAEALIDAYRSFATEPVATTHPVPRSHQALAAAARFTGAIEARVRRSPAR